MMQSTRLAFAAAIAALVSLSPLSAHAQTIIDEWGAVKAPPPPALKQPTLDRKTTALLLLDFNRQTCNEERRPRCVASIPKVKKLLAAARDAGMPVAFTLGGGGKPEDLPKDLAPQANEPVALAGVDKFVGTELESFLNRHGVKTVIVVGTAAHGAVLYTASGAVLRKLQVVLPVDGMSGDTPYTEQYTAWHLVNAPTFGNAVTLTTLDAVKF
jgi:nicotinamidase-related amidase